MNRQFLFEQETSCQNEEKIARKMLGTSKVLLFGVIALFMAIIEIPLGIFVHTGAEFISIVWGQSFAYVITVLTVLVSIPMVLSLFFAVLALIVYKASQRSMNDQIGLAAAILSTVICVAGIALYTASFFV